MNAVAEQVPHRPSWLVPFIILLAAGACLGFSTALAKVAVEAGVSPYPFLTWSILGATAALTAFAVKRKRLPSVNKRTVEYFIVAAFVTVAGSNLIFFSAVEHVGVGFVSLVIALPPLLTYIGALVFRMEQFSWMRSAGVFAALCGAGMLALGKISAPDTSVFWVLLTLTGPVLLAVGNIYRTLRWPPGASADALAPGMAGVGTAMLLAAALLPGFSLEIPTDTSQPILLIAIQAIVFTAQFLLMFVLQKVGGPVLLSLLGSVGAVFGVPLAVFLLHETPPEGLFLGAGLIAAGVGLVTVGGLKKIVP